MLLTRCMPLWMIAQAQHIKWNAPFGLLSKSSRLWTATRSQSLFAQGQLYTHWNTIIRSMSLFLFNFFHHLLHRFPKPHSDRRASKLIVTSDSLLWWVIYSRAESGRHMEECVWAHKTCPVSHDTIIQCTTHSRLSSMTNAIFADRFRPFGSSCICPEK